jgi:hypothetical protein
MSLLFPKKLVSQLKKKQTFNRSLLSHMEKLLVTQVERPSKVEARFEHSTYRPESNALIYQLSYPARQQQQCSGQNINMSH